MKFTLVVRQAAVLEAGLVGKVNPNDLCLLDYLRGWSAHDGTKTMDVEGQKFFWLHCEHAIKELPLLFRPLAKVASRRNQLCRMIGKLRKTGLVNTKLIGRRLYLRLTEKGVRLTQPSKSPAPPVKNSAPIIKPPHDDTVTPRQDEIVTSPHDEHPSAIINETVTKENEKKETPPLSPLEGEAESILSFWNSFSELPRAAGLTKNRIRQIRNRLAEAYWRDHWREGIQSAATSSFLTGGGPKGWRANFDWFLRSDSLNRILEGHYETLPDPEQVKADLIQLEAELESEENPDKRQALRRQIKILENQRRNRTQVYRNPRPSDLNSKINAIDELIAEHPANGNSSAYDEFRTSEQLTELRQLRNQRTQLVRQLAGVSRTTGESASNGE